MARVLLLVGCLLLTGCGRFGFEDTPTDAAVDAGLGTLVPTAMLKAASLDANDYFGYAVALSSDRQTLAISARWEDSSSPGIDGNRLDNGASNAGALYVFGRTDTGWVEQAYLKAADPAAGAELGVRMVMSPDGSTLLGCAWGVNGGAGAVYVFVRTGSTWRQQAKLVASDAAGGSSFGSEVTISDDGNTAAIGAFDGAGGRGSAYVFERSGETWTETARFAAVQGEAGDAFGDAVALSGDGQLLAIASAREDSAGVGVDGDLSGNAALDAGVVFIYRKNGAAWNYSAHLKASDSTAGLLFGHRVALSTDGSRLAVVAGGYAQYVGAVYTFVHDDVAGWIEETRLVASNAQSSDEGGWALATSPSGSVVVSGARGAMMRAGAAYVFRLDATGWVEHSALVAPMPVAGDTFGHSLVIAGSTLGVGMIGESTGSLRSGAVLVFEPMP